MIIPIVFDAILERWESAFPSGVQEVDLGTGLTIKDDLLRIVLLEQRRDGRIDIPDLYRAGFGLAGQWGQVL